MWSYPAEPLPVSATMPLSQLTSGLAEGRSLWGLLGLPSSSADPIGKPQREKNVRVRGQGRAGCGGKPQREGNRLSTGSLPSSRHWARGTVGGRTGTVESGCSRVLWGVGNATENKPGHLRSDLSSLPRGEGFGVWGRGTADWAASPSFRACVIGTVSAQLCAPGSVSLFNSVSGQSSCFTP